MVRRIQARANCKSTSNEAAHTKVVRYCARRKVNSNELFARGVLAQTEELKRLLHDI